MTVRIVTDSACDLTAGEAVIAARGEPPVTISLADLAEGNPRAQRPFPPARF